MEGLEGLEGLERLTLELARGTQALPCILRCWLLLLLQPRPSALHH